MEDFGELKQKFTLTNTATLLRSDTTETPGYRVGTNTNKRDKLTHETRRRNLERDMASISSASKEALQRQLRLRRMRARFIQGFQEGALRVPVDDGAASRWMVEGGFSELDAQQLQRMPCSQLYASSIERLQAEIGQIQEQLQHLEQTGSASAPVVAESAQAPKSTTSASNSPQQKRPRTRSRSESGCSPTLNPAKAFLKSPALTAADGNEEGVFESNFFL